MGFTWFLEQTANHLINVIKILNFCNGEVVCFPWGKNRIFKRYRGDSSLENLKSHIAEVSFVLRRSKRNPAFVNPAWFMSSLTLPLMCSWERTFGSAEIRVRMSVRTAHQVVCKSCSNLNKLVDIRHHVSLAETSFVFEVCFFNYFKFTSSFSLHLFLNFILYMNFSYKNTDSLLQSIQGCPNWCFRVRHYSLDLQSALNFSYKGLGHCAPFPGWNLIFQLVSGCQRLVCQYFYKMLLVMEICMEAFWFTLFLPTFTVFNLFRYKECARNMWRFLKWNNVLR
jgi:hypothetical protein